LLKLALINKKYASIPIYIKRAESSILKHNGNLNNQEGFKTKYFLANAFEQQNLMKEAKKIAQ
jgi:hypothetical protein